MRTCPECYIEMKQANRQGVDIDFCPQCRGVWLDHGELEKLIERATHVPYQTYQAPPGYQQGQVPSYGHGGHQNPPAYAAHQSQPAYGDHRHAQHKPYKKHHKHKHPVADFLDDVFDIFG